MSLSKTRHTKPNGFTLIELLVVIAIIAILAAILFPVFGRARENGRRAACQSNLKQIGIGMMQYSQDYDEKVIVRHLVVNGNPVSWRALVQPYIKSIQVFNCPSNPGNAAIANYDNGVFTNCYAMNGETSPTLGGTPPSNSNGDSQNLAAIGSASQVIFAGEIDQVWPWPNLGVNTTNPTTYAGRFFKGHLGTSNFLFMDGHVKAMKPIATGTPVNMWIIEDDQAGPAALLANLNAWTAKVNAG
ncbi:DUF1559 domain-containing protein [bacterium]|nr:MAG: DUF1559 domain-containing protein [bacterium]